MVEEKKCSKSDCWCDSQLILLRAHRWDNSINDLLLSLRASLNHVWILFDTTTTSGVVPSEIKNDLRLIAVNDDMCRKWNLLHKSCYHTPEASFVIAFRRVALEKPQIQYMWVIEYDVRCSGDWHDLFALTKSMREDFLATGVERYSAENARWHWWGIRGGWCKTIMVGNEKIVIDTTKRPPTSLCAKSFLPISRYSCRFVEVLAQQLHRMSAFCEVYLPSICLQQSGFTVGNLPQNLLSDSHFRYGDPFPPQDIKIDKLNPKLYHPVRV